MALGLYRVYEFNRNYKGPSTGNEDGLYDSKVLSRHCPKLRILKRDEWVEVKRRGSFLNLFWYIGI